MIAFALCLSLIAATTDAGRSVVARSSGDARTSADAGTSVDARTPPDAGTPRDAGTAADAGVRAMNAADNLRAPLGHLGDSVTQAPTDGVPSTERVATVTLPGCEKPQAIWLSRFLLGSAVGGAQVHMWLAKRPELSKKLFGKGDPLADAIQRSRRTVGAEEVCEAAGDWKLRPSDVEQQKRCEKAVKLTTPPESLDQLFLEKGKVAAQVRLRPSSDGAVDRCRPRLSTLLLDRAGVARFALHADYGGMLTAEVFGDRCELLTFTFDEASQSFVATPSRRPDCGKSRAGKAKK